MKIRAEANLTHPGIPISTFSLLHEAQRIISLPHADDSRHQIGIELLAVGCWHVLTTISTTLTLI